MSDRLRLFSLLGTVSLVVAVAFVLGRWSVSEGDEAVVAARGPAAHTHAPALLDAPEPAGVGSPSLAPPLASEVVEGRSPVAELDAALSLARQAVKAPDDEHLEEAVEAAAGKLERRLLSDPLAMKAALERFGQLTTEAELETLAAALGRARDFEVEELALQVASSDTLTERRVAALHILDALDSPRATDVALDVLVRESDPRVRRAAVFAIPEPQGTSAADAQRVVATLGRAAQFDVDPELRRRAVIQLGAWHHTTADLAPVLRLLAADPSVDVRAGAAFALEVAVRREPSVLSALARAMNDRGEDSLVRHNAWRALGRLGPLPDSIARDYATFASEAARTEGG